jgi:hypothetical protein
MNNKLSESWIFQDIQRASLISWITSLKYFYFIRAIGGYANDGDAFVCELKFNSQDQVTSILEKIGIKNSGYNLLLNAIKCYISIKEKKIEFSVFGSNGNLYEVSQGDYESCRKIESLFDKFSLYRHLDSDIEKQINCISKNNYPELFK